MRSRILVTIAMVCLLAAPFTFAADQTKPLGKPAELGHELLMPNNSPLITFRILFMTGAASDPKGKEGLATLTASMISDAGSKAVPYEKVLEEMYPMATSFSSQVDKEMTVFSGTTHIDNLDKYYKLISGMLLDPGFRQEDFERVKTDQINYLKTGLRAQNDEERGKEQLYLMIYPPDHPYGHENAGAINALEKLTLDDVKGFYREHYTQANLVLGLAGRYPQDFAARVQADLRKLPAGKKDAVAVGIPRQAAGTKIDIVQRDTRSTAISIGFPVNVTRADKDFPALALVASYLGQHRDSNSYLYQRIREARGLNYGDYAYVEYFPGGMYMFQPRPNLGRRSQIFQIWIRPVEPDKGQFALRAALYEFDKLVKDGMTRESFESTREFLTKYVNILTSTQNAQLGYALDSHYYGIPEYTRYMREQLAKLTLEDVNKAIKTHLKSDSLRIAMVTKDAEGLRKALVADAPSPITYVSPKPKEILDEDKIIEKYPIKVSEADVRVVPVDTVFQ